MGISDAHFTGLMGRLSAFSYLKAFNTYSLAAGKSKPGLHHDVRGLNSPLSMEEKTQGLIKGREDVRASSSRSFQSWEQKLPNRIAFFEMLLADSLPALSRVPGALTRFRSRFISEAKAS